MIHEKWKPFNIYNKLLALGSDKKVYNLILVYLNHEKLKTFPVLQWYAKIWPTLLI